MRARSDGGPARETAMSLLCSVIVNQSTTDHCFRLVTFVSSGPRNNAALVNIVSGVTVWGRMAVRAYRRNWREAPGVDGMGPNQSL